MDSSNKNMNREETLGLTKAKGVKKSGLFHTRQFMSAALLVSDAMSLFLSGWAAVAIRTLLNQIPANSFLSISRYFDPAEYPKLMPVILFFILVYASRRLYPTIGLNRMDEVRQLTISTTLVVALYATILFLSQRALIYSRFVFALFWLAALFLVPLGRVFTRNILVRLSLWGVPVGIVGSGSRTSRTVEFLSSRPNLGFRPAIMFNGGKKLKDREASPAEVDIEILEREDSNPILKELDTLIIIQDETPESIFRSLVGIANKDYPRIMIMPDLPSVATIWVQPVDLNGVLALKLRNNLAYPIQQFQKRLTDLMLAGIISLLTFPLLGLLAIAIRLDSKGPVFFVQQRVGRGGRIFPMLKFRTMYIDAEERLRRILDENTEIQTEWEKYQKLKNDPRVTKVGAVLRSFSLDELPQLWNVLRGEMSLVGPRPFLSVQQELYGESYQNYIQVRPGITGMWQISGRNESSFSERAKLDEYYVRNWSLWMDLYILARTPFAVLSCDGAY